MFHKSKINKAVRLSWLASAAALAASSYSVNAQESDAAEASEFEKVQVTGSRIKRTDVEGANPVTTIDAVAIERMSVTNVGDLLQNLSSSAGAATNTQTNNGGDSATRFSLRGLGEERTLVLLNGRRIVAGGAGADIAVDLNTIPVAIIKRVEVLKDGASSIYGSDAIAGVVNIITKDDFEGFELSFNKGISAEGDAGVTGFDLTFGANSERGNVIVTLGVNDQEDAFQGDRAFSEYELRAYADGSTQQGGSSAPPWSNVDGAPGSAEDPENPLADNNVSRGTDFGEWRDYSGATDSYNYNPVNYLQTPSKRKYVNVFANYDLGDFGFVQDVKSFVEVGYSNTVGEQLIAPEPLAPLVFFGSEAPYSPDNYYNHTYGPKDADGNSYVLNDWRRRMLETGGRAAARDFKTLRTVVGLNGLFENGWEWELSYNHGTSDAIVQQSGYFQLQRVADAVGKTGWLDANGDVMTDGDGNVLVAPEGGQQLVCLDESDAIIGGCVPLNIFGQPGTDTQVTPEMLQYISGDYNTTELGQNTQEVFTALVSGTAFELPAGDVGFAVGYESRKESGSYTPDSLILQGITTAGSAVATNGGYAVDELYGEAIVPILADAPFAELLELSVAVRYSDYDSFGDNTSGKIGVKWKPTSSLLARATISDAFRAPAIADLVEGAYLDYPEATDPCDSDTYADGEYADVVASSNFANCVATGVPAAGYASGSVEQIPTQLGGASNWNGAISLTPETADVLTVGVVYTPEYVENLSMSVDYWSIELTNALSGVGTQVRLDECFNSGLYCETINRFTSGAAHGNIINVEDYIVNVGGIDTSGIDFDIRYALDTSVGEFTFAWDGTYLLEYVKHLATQSVDHTGTFNVDHDGLFAELKSNITVAWTQDDMAANVAVRYIDGVTEVEKGWWTDPFERNVDSNVVVDVQGTYQVTDNIQVSMGIDNLFDQEPPFVFSAFGANTDVNSYDVIGRYGYIRTKVSF